MSNYYTILTTFVPGTKVRSDEVNAELTAISAGFDYLPTANAAIVLGKTYKGTEGGSGNSYTVTMDDTRTTYVDGDRVLFKATHTNTGAASIGLDAVGLISLVLSDGSACVAGDILSGRYYEATYVGASNHFQLMGPGAELLAGSTAQTGYAQEWAVKAEDTLVSTAAGGNGVDDYSALHWAAKAAADAVSTAADAASTAADLVQTNLDQISCASDAADTAADLVQTNLDQISCDADATATAADRVQTGLDAAATAADLVLTDADQVSCTAAAVATAADVVSTNADAVSTANDVTYAAEWANKAEDSLVSAAAGGDLVDDYSSLHWANKAAASAAGVNLPSIVGGDADKILEVNAGETGYELTARAATDAATGFVELATNAEVTTGTDTARAVTPAGLHQKTASATAIGLVELATDAEAITGTDTSRAVTPANVYALLEDNDDGVVNPSLNMNGQALIWQRGTSFAAMGSTEYLADRWFYSSNSTGVLTGSRLTRATGDTYYAIQLDVTTADTSIASTVYCNLVTHIEGPDVQTLRLGQADAKDVTLTFEHAHTKTGTHSVVLRNAAQNRTYVAEYTQTTTNTWEKSTVTIPADTSGTWAVAAATIGLTVLFCVAVGTNFQGTAGSWAGANYTGSTNQVNNLDSVSNFFRITNFKLEAGSRSTPNIPRTAGFELLACQRHYQRVEGQAAANGSMQSSTNATMQVPLACAMMRDPTPTYTVGDHRVRSNGANMTPTAFTGFSQAENGSNASMEINATVTGGTQYHACSMRSNNAVIELDAEL